jgi:hypothetical protein
MAGPDVVLAPRLDATATIGERATSRGGGGAQMELVVIIFNVGVGVGVALVGVAAVILAVGLRPQHAESRGLVRD